MTYYDKLYEIAIDNHYLVTTEVAREAGIPAVELAKLAYRGRLVNIGRGLYRLARYVPSEIDPYAIAVALMGDGAYLGGESVIALLGLAPTNPAYMTVVVPGRTRKKTPPRMRIEKAQDDDRVTVYRGIRSQHVATAIKRSAATMMTERLQDAAERARVEGYLTTREHRDLKEAMGW